MNRDSTRADTVFATDYQGTSVDLTDENPTPFFFAKSDEIRAIGGLQQDIDVSGVEMAFADSTTWLAETHPGDNDWVTVTVYSPIITILRPVKGDLEVRGTQSIEFKVKPITSGSQTLWQIVRWTEVHNAPPS